MFTVYKITNLVNNKCYIGSSIQVEKRWKQHKNVAFNQNSSCYNYPLYKAFRKYGLENFSFEVLKDDFISAQEMEEFEYQSILYYNSYNNGYNQTLKTNQSSINKENLSKYIQKISCKCAKIDKNNNILEIYNSYHDAARKNNLDGDHSATKIRAVCKGDQSSINNELFFRDLDENGNIIPHSFKSYKGRKKLIAVNIDNPDLIKYFSSISEAAKELNTERKSIQQCIQGSDRYSKVKGYIFREVDENGNIIETFKTIEERIKEYNETNPLINGERHNITEWCSIFKISKNCYYYRRKKGMGVIEALTLQKGR